MSREKIIINSPGPILPGKHLNRARQMRQADLSLSSGSQLPAWATGSINGRPTTKAISEDVARECQKRIENYKELQKKIEDTVAEALDQAPWTKEQKK